MWARRPAALHALSAALLLGLWQIAAALMDSRTLPPPLVVFQVLLDGLADGELAYHVGITLARVAASFAIAMAIGVAAGIAMGRSPGLDRFFDGWPRWPLPRPIRTRRSRE